MNSFLEILDYCGYDVAKAHEMAKAELRPEWVEEALNEVGLETIQPESETPFSR